MNKTAKDLTAGTVGGIGQVCNDHQDAFALTHPQL